LGTVTKLSYTFGLVGYSETQSEFPPTLEMVGGKGLHLIEMSGLRLHVPSGVILTTQTCNSYLGPYFQFAYLMKDTLIWQNV